MVIYEKGTTIGRKFLVAGKGGFNLSHNMTLPELSKQYTPSDFMSQALEAFDVSKLRDWYQELGISTYVGTSNRIFPEKGISPGDVLRKISSKLKSQGVEIKYKHEFIGFSQQGIPLLKNGDHKMELNADMYIFALGGASWKVTGSDGGWLDSFTSLGIKTAPFEASNSGVEIKWPSTISGYHIGKPLKNIRISHNSYSVKGEAVISSYGLEGNAIYPISAKIREALNEKNEATIFIDFKPQQTHEQLVEKIKNTAPNNFSTVLKLDSAQIALIKSVTTKEQFLNANKFIQSVKALPIKVTSLRPIEESISTVGGIETSELNADFSLKKRPRIYCVGEMVNWDAPTGGFLLQGCFSMSCLAGTHIKEALKSDC